MTERDFLNARSRRIRRRLGHRSTEIHNRLEETLCPVVREHPRTALALGASAGLLLGALLGPALRAPVLRGGILRGAAGLAQSTGAHALRTTLAKSILDAFASTKESPSSGGE